MIKHNPFQILCDFIQYYVQKFALHMLDNYGILVSRWAWLIVLADSVYFTYRDIMNPLFKGGSLNVTSICFNIIFITYLVRATAKQLRYEINSDYKKHEKERQSWDLTVLKSIVLIVLIVFIIPPYLVDIVNNIAISTIFITFYKLISFTLIFFMSCYTRNREPPLLGSTQFST